MMPGRIKLLTDITHNWKWHVMGCVRTLRPWVWERPAYMCLEKMFCLGVWNGGNLVRTDLCLSQFLDTYISNLLHFDTERRRILNHCAELYYICASSVEKKKKQNALGSLMECSSARGVTGLHFFLSFSVLFKKNKKAAHLIWREKTTILLSWSI